MIRQGAMTNALKRLPSNILRELAVIAEQKERESNPWRLLRQAAVDEALAMLSSGEIPALGWWRSHLPRAPVDRDWPEMPPSQRPSDWKPWELIAAAVGLADDGISVDVSRDVLAVLAASHGLAADALADAYTALEES